jgi:hypothetical protein
MSTDEAARRWAATWQRAWERLDAPAIEALYAENAEYVSAPFRESEPSRQYLARAFADETNVQAWFGDPIVEGDRAAVQWWAALTENGRDITLAGTSVLRFDGAGLVVSQWDAWNEASGRRAPHAGWGSRDGDASP